MAVVQSDYRERHRPTPGTLDLHFTVHVWRFARMWQVNCSAANLALKLQARSSIVPGVLKHFREMEEKLSDTRISISFVAGAPE